MRPIPSVNVSAETDADAQCQCYWYKSMWTFQVSTITSTPTLGVNTASECSKALQRLLPGRKMLFSSGLVVS